MASMFAVLKISKTILSSLSSSEKGEYAYNSPKNMKLLCLWRREKKSISFVASPRCPLQAVGMEKTGFWTRSQCALRISNTFKGWLFLLKRTRLYEMKNCVQKAAVVYIFTHYGQKYPVITFDNLPFILI